MFRYRKISQGQALVITRQGAVTVSFTPRLVPMFLSKVETMDISLKTIEIDRRGEEGLICRDNIRADIKVAFFVRVNKSEEDVIRVAQSIGCKRASDVRTLDELFSAKFSEALKTVGKQLDFVDLYTKREDFRDQIIQVIGRDLNGYVLEDAAIDFLEQTPLKSLDPANILDAQGIRKITELTATESVKTNEFQNLEKKQIRKQDVEAQEAILELNRQEADAVARQQREIAIVQARETAETERVRAEERLRAESAKIKTDEDLAIQGENMQRQVEVATKNRERVVAVESERVEKDRQLEAISRERETELRRIDKDKEVEEQKKQIADIVRERVAVDRTVAEEEERIKELRVLEEARRNKEAQVVAAEAVAQSGLVKDIKAAEARDQAAKFLAAERLTQAEAQLEASDKEAKAKIRMAEGIKAEAAATGLADVLVKEQNAAAVEKEGRAEASVLREKLSAEAAGIRDKADAMAALSEASRGHEEFRLRLDKEKEIELGAIDAQRQVAEAQAGMLADALQKAKIDIVGGDGEFFDKLVGAVGMGKSVDRFFDRSEVASRAIEDYQNGNASLRADLKEIVANLGGGSGGVGQMTLAALVGHMIGSSDGEKKAQLEKLLEAAQDMGIADAEL